MLLKLGRAHGIIAFLDGSEAMRLGPGGFGGKGFGGICGPGPGCGGLGGFGFGGCGPGAGLGGGLVEVSRKARRNRFRLGVRIIVCSVSAA